MEEPVRDDAAHLKSLRLAADLDHAQLALMVNLSAAQVRQLEEDGDSLFYSPQIKAQSLRRVIRTLENASQEPQSVASIEPPAPRSSASVIDDIIRLSEKNLKSQVVHSEVRRPGASWPKLLGTWGLAALLLGLGLWQYNRHNSQALYEEWVEPITAKVLPAPQMMKTEEVATAAPDIIAPAAAPLKTKTAQVPDMPSLPSATSQSQDNTAAPSLQAALPAATASTPTTPAPASLKLANISAALPAATATGAATKDSTEAVNPIAAADCASIKTEPITVSSVSPNKPGSYVYLVANKATTVCVEDGKNKRTLVTLTPGAGRSVHGAAPWTLASTDLKALQVYFQGAKVWLPPEAGSRIYLKEQPISP
jgi:hypothetical protein